MAFTLAEGLVDEVVTYLTDNLPARLDLIDTEMTDSLVLADPVVYETAEKSLESLAKYPVCVVLVPDTTIGQWTGVEVWGEHSLLIGMIVLDVDPTDLRKRLYRYARALFEELADAHGDGGITWNIGVGPIEINFSPLFSAPDSQFIGDMQITVPMVKKETR